ncbi:hypothetical protein [Kitasatospora fiedleri]|uniref:hypothetical protein n=1 Tax=Kitasatospora fiedleri TaxID=2991545 RepID=UPI00249A50AD|nr:hypothetical protein [Kitasatospora fiedleri]
MSTSDKDRTPERPVEQLLRAALAARAAQVTPRGLRPAEPPRRRPRHLRPVLTVALPLALAAALTGWLSLRTDRPVDRPAPAPAAGVSASPEPSPAPSAPAEPSAGTVDQGAAPPTGRHRVFHGVGFTLPAGWTVPDQDPADGLCLLSPGSPTQQPGDCLPYGVRLVSAGGGRDGTAWPTEYGLDAEDGWKGLGRCPVWGHPGELTGAAGPQRAADRKVVTLGGRVARQVTWHVDCGNGSAFDATVWGFHAEQVYLVAAGLADDYRDALTELAQSLDIGALTPGAGRPHPNDVKVDVSLPQVLDTRRQPGFQQPFTITYTDFGAVPYTVQPELRLTADPGLYHGAAADLVAERLDGERWTKLPGLAADASGSGAAAAFTLAPGESRTVRYRLTFAGEDDSGPLSVTGAAVAAGPGDVGTQSFDVLLP